MPPFKAMVLETRKETPDTKTVRFEASFPFQPGQYVSLKLAAGAKTFSISVSPGKGFIEITTKLTGSAFKQEFDKLKKGDTASMVGPLGSFTFNENDRNSCFFVGGIGITPFRSMLEYIAGKKIPVNVVVFYSNKTPEDIAFREELESIAKQNKNIKIIHAITRPEQSKTPWKGLTGHVNAEIVKQNIPGWQNRTYYICGPPGFVEAVEKTLSEIGIPKEKTKLEKFTGY